MVEIHVEFYGVPRQRSGVARTTVSLATGSVTLSELLELLCHQFPQLLEDCVLDGRLAPGMIANLSGDQFITDSVRKIDSDETVLLMSSDCGG